MAGPNGASDSKTMSIIRTIFSCKGRGGREAGMGAAVAAWRFWRAWRENFRGLVPCGGESRLEPPSTERALFPRRPRNPHEEADDQGNRQGDGGAEHHRDGPKRIEIADIQGGNDLKQRRRRQRGKEGSQEEAPQEIVRARGERNAQSDENGKTDGAFAHGAFISLPDTGART